MNSGLPTVFGIKPWKESSTPKHQVGSKGYTNDGRVFRYIKADGALTLGHVSIAADLVGNHEDIGTNTHAIGDKSITATAGATAVTANMYTNGYVVVNDDTGQGTSYGIEGHTTVSAAGGDITVYLKDRIRITAIAGTTVTLVRNPYRDVITGPGDATLDIFTGVPILTISDGYYGWTQTGGICSVLSDATVPVALRGVIISNGVAGSVEVVTAIATETVIGQALNMTYVDGEYNPIQLTWDN